MSRIVALHKPRGVLSSTRPEGGARTVYELLPPADRGLFAVGRLDKDSEGLLLFCDDSRLAQRLMDPGGIPKVYMVTVEGFPREEDLEAMRRGGLVIEGRTARGVEVERLGKAPRGGTRLRVVLREGLNREIRRLFSAAACSRHAASLHHAASSRHGGFRVRRLVRVAVGPVELGDLPSGATRELSEKEVASLLAELRRRGATPASASH
jgi:pseudouridine synthase